MLRRLRLLTVVGFFKSRYEDTAGMLAAVAICATNVGWAGAQLVAFGYILHALVGISTTMGVLVATVIVLTYTAAGRMWAVTLAGVTTWLASGILFPTLPADLFGLLASALGLLIATPLTQGVDPPWPLRDVEGNVVPLRDRLGILNPFARAARS